MKLGARFQRWWHCLTHLHRPMTIRNYRGDVTVIGCGDCRFASFVHIEDAESCAAAIRHLFKQRASLQKAKGD